MLSDDQALLETVVLMAARRIDAVRVAHGRRQGAGLVSVEQGLARHFGAAASRRCGQPRFSECAADACALKK